MYMRGVGGGEGGMHKSAAMSHKLIYRVFGKT